MTISKSFAKVVVATLLLAPNAYGWGRRGHSTVNTTAGYILANTSNARMLKERSFDLGYYANVPDIIWKKPASFAKEKPEHYLDVEHFETALKTPAKDWRPEQFLKDRLQFFAKYPGIEHSSGRAPWRVQEFAEKLAALVSELKDSGKSAADHKALQLQWLVVAGTLGHYIGDLAQPMHCTENHDGALTHQQGLHSYFEEAVVDYLYPELEKDILKESLKAWPEFKKSHAQMEPFDIALELARDSFKKLPQTLRIDKSIGRESLPKAARAYRQLVKERLIKGSLYLALIWSRYLDWPYNDDKFFNFEGNPEWIAIPEAPVSK